MEDRVKLEDGAGAKESWKIIDELFLSRVPPELRRTLGGFGLDVLDDGAGVKVDDRKYLVFTTDSFTVNPPFFPGGNIGYLAAHGTLNDLVMMGAKPVAFMDTIIVEEGFLRRELNEIVSSMLGVMLREGVSVVGGDFKVMPKGSIDRIVITGIGIGITDNPIIDEEIRVGDKILVTGPIAEHGAAILASQLGMIKETKSLRSDTKPLTKTVLPVIRKFRKYIHAARDPTRGGIAATLNEWIMKKNATILIKRQEIPIREEVKSFLEALGVDPYSTASEGIAVLAVDPEKAEEIAEELIRSGESSTKIVGEVITPPSEFLKGKVVAETEVGGKILLEPKSVNLPRIC